MANQETDLTGKGLQVESNLSLFFYTGAVFSTLTELYISITLFNISNIFITK